MAPSEGSLSNTHGHSVARVLDMYVTSAVIPKVCSLFKFDPDL